jgi:hypothetical protein
MNLTKRILQRYRRPGQTWADIADIAVRVFMMKLKELKRLILKKRIFGKVVAYAYSIELQQRGLQVFRLIVFKGGLFSFQECRMRISSSFWTTIAS